MISNSIDNGLPAWFFVAAVGGEPLKLKRMGTAVQSILEVLVERINIIDATCQVADLWALVGVDPNKQGEYVSDSVGHHTCSICLSRYFQRRYEVVISGKVSCHVADTCLSSACQMPR